MSLTPVHQWQFATGINDTSGTGGKFAASVVDTNCAHWLVNISANFRKNSKWPSYYFQGLQGKRIHVKNLKKTISWQCPFNPSCRCVTLTICDSHFQRLQNSVVSFFYFILVPMNLPMMTMRLMGRLFAWKMPSCLSCEDNKLLIIREKQRHFCFFVQNHQGTITRHDRNYSTTIYNFSRREIIFCW